jgi:hypothetical protein
VVVSVEISSHFSDQSRVMSRVSRGSHESGSLCAMWVLVEVLSSTVVYVGCGWMVGRCRVEFLEQTGKLKSTKESS